MNDYKNNIISFGSGGDFAGTETTYSILENGQVFVSTGLATMTTTKFNSISKKQAKILFEKAAKIDWSKPTINDPGNIYYTLGYGKGDAATKQIWGNNQVQPSKEITELYTELSQVIIKK
ncbi:MAG: hypothetical protein IPL21_17070 [Saprospirales bacterium]|nr:hypothetical protein [Saprospirales bacterium]